MEYSKPKVTIDLDEYNDLIDLLEVLISFMNSTYSKMDDSAKQEFIRFMKSNKFHVSINSASNPWLGFTLILIKDEK